LVPYKNLPLSIDLFHKKRAVSVLSTAVTSQHPSPTYEWAFWVTQGKRLYWQASGYDRFGRLFVVGMSICIRMGQ
jgi:hypothetical protein